jgi:autotransporter-associated beta strand protein
MRVAAALVLLGSSLTLPAATIVWENTGTTFSTGGNWVDGVAPANDLTTDIGSFQAATPAFQPQLTANRSINGLEFTSGTGAWTFTGSSGTRVLTLGSGGIVSNANSTQTFGSNLGIAIGASTSFTSNGSGVLNFTTNLGSFNIGTAFTLTLTGSSTAANTIAEVIADSSNNGRITKSGSGTWVLSGNNTYGGATTISDGVLSVSNLANGGTASNIGNSSNAAANLVFDGGTLRHTLNGVDSTNRNFTITTGKIATIDISDAAGNLTISGAAAATTGGLTKIGAGTLTLSGANAYTGATTIGSAGGVSGGTIALGGNERIANASSVTVYAGTFNVNSRTETISGLNLGGGASGTTAAVSMTTGTLNLGGDLAYDATNNPNGATITGGTLGLGANRVFTIGDSSAATSDLAISSVISGTNFGFNKQGAGTLTLSGANTYTGATTIGAGVLSISDVANGGANSNLGAASTAAANLVFDGGTLQFTGATDSTNRNFTINTGKTATVDVTTLATNLTISGAAAATTGGLTKIGAGTLTLSGGNAYTGATTISAGTLSVSDVADGGVNSNLGAASTAAANLVFDGGTLQFTGATDSTNRDFTINSGKTATVEVTNASTTLTLSGSTTATTGELTKTGDGTLKLSGTNLHSGLTTVSDGTLLASGNNSLGAAAGNVTVSAGATLALDAGTTIVRSGLLTLNGAGAAVDAGALHAAGGTASTSQWNGSITVSTASTISAADNLLIVGNGATGQFNSTTLTLNSDVTFHTPNTAAVVPTYLPAPSYVLDPANIMVHSRITGSGGLIKTGDGTLSIIRGTSVENTFTGDTQVLGGKLIVEGPSNKAHLSSTNIFVGNLGSTNDSTVVLQSGQATGTAPGNNMIGVYNLATNASNSNLTIYEDGLYNMNRSSNGFVNLTLHGGRIDGVGLDPLLTISGDLLSRASAQTSLIENSNLGIGSSTLTMDVEAGTTSSGIDLQIDARIQQGVGFTALSSGTALEKTGEGKAVFTADNTYGGVTAISNGVLNIQHASALGQNSGSLGLTSHGTVVTGDGQLQLEGNITVVNETLTLSGSGHGGTGALRNTGGSNTYEGVIYLDADSRIRTDSGTTLTIANPNGVNSLILDGNSAGKALEVVGDGNTTINGGIGSNIGALTKNNAGTLTLAGQNSYTGATTISGGAVKVTHNNALSGTGVSVSSGAALQFAQNASNQDITAVGVAATIAGTGLGNGGAIQNLNGNNTYLGNVTLADNARISADAGSSLTLSGNVTGAGYGLEAGGAGNTTYNGVISGTALSKTDAGTVTLGGSSANTYSGATSIAAGTLALNKTAGVTAISSTAVTIGDGIGAANSATLLLSQSNQINDSAAIALNSDGRFDVNGKTETVGSIAGSGAIIFGTGQLIAGGNDTSTSYTGTLVGDSTASFTKTGSGTLTITSDVNAAPGDFAGTLNLNAGALAFNVDNAFTGTLNVFAGTTLKLSDTDLTVTNLNFTGSGTITLDFSGTSTLSVNQLTIAAGITVNIINWTNATDYFFAQNWSGAIADITGQTPMNQIVFASFTGNDTKWQSYDDQITPVPEPSTYGALLIGAAGALLGWRRWRKRRPTANAQG